MCPKCKKNLQQKSGLWSPQTPNRSYRTYFCYDCMVKYVEIVDTQSHEVVGVDETFIGMKREKQITLGDF